MKNLKYIIFPALITLLCSCHQDAAGPPNILFILADDYSYDAVHAMGNKLVQTPAIDELARIGTTFTTAYNMGGWNGAICIASRAMFNTGRFLWRAEQADHHMDSLASQGMVWSREMARLGYITYFTGKWHVKTDPGTIFHHVGTQRPGMPPDTPRGYNRPLDEYDQEWTPWDSAFGGYWEGGVHWSEVVASETVGFLEEAARSEKPFFMYVAFNAPHDPRQSPREFVERYPQGQVPVPDNFLPDYPYRDLIGCGPGLRDEALAPFPRTAYSVQVHRQEYYAIISHMDAQIKRILDKLDETGRSDNTLIFFTADHGLSVGHHGLMGKQNMYEHSLRPPLIVAGPDIPKGEHIGASVYIQDIMPTAIEYGGGKVPGYVDFQSLRPFLNGSRKTSSYPAVYGAYMDLQRMIRTGDYKLIVYPKAGITRLFNLARDEQEMWDLASDPDHHDRIREMYRDLQLLMDGMGDTLKLPALN